MKFREHPERKIRHFLSMPFIYMMIIPSVLFDLMMEIYHNICFPLYGLPKVKRSNYIRVDRHKIKSLRFMEKVNCMYCGYVNGLLAYAVEIAARTETYWCGIKHKGGGGYIESKHHAGFIEYDEL